MVDSDSHLPLVYILNSMSASKSSSRPENNNETVVAWCNQVAPTLKMLEDSRPFPTPFSAKMANKEVLDALVGVVADILIIDANCFQVGTRLSPVSMAKDDAAYDLYKRGCNFAQDNADLYRIGLPSEYDRARTFLRDMNGVRGRSKRKAVRLTSS